MHGKILTEGNIKSQLWALAWPIMLSVFFNTLYNTVDAFWVSKISPEAIAAVSISQIALFIMVAFSMGITVGSGVVMGMHIGAKEPDKAQKILGQSFVLSAVAGVLVTILALLFKEQLLSFGGATGTILNPAREYFDVVAAGSILLFIMFTIVFAFNAQGDNKTVTKLFAISTGINTLLDPIMIFGWAGLPALGIRGAAIATLISQLIFIILAMRILTRATMLVPFRWSNLSFHWQSVKRVIDIGFPAALTNALGPLGIAVTTLMVASYFSEPGAVAMSIGFRVEFFAFLPAIGYGVGSMAMLGQNMGAKKIDRARAAYRRALVTGSSLAAGLGILIFALASPIVRAFTSDALVTEYARSYLLLVPLSYAFLAAMIIEATSFQGMGKSWPGFWITIIRIVTVVTVSWILLQFTNSIIAIWLGVVAGYALASVVGYIWLNYTMKKISQIPATSNLPAT